MSVECYLLVRQFQVCLYPPKSPNWESVGQRRQMRDPWIQSKPSSSSTLLALMNSCPSTEMSLQNALMSGLTTSALRHDDDTLATIHICFLRLHILNLNYDAADRLIEKSDFPEKVPGTLQARHHYYVARIRAVQGRYDEALDNLMQCIRKGPSTSVTLTIRPRGIGFLQAVHKLFVTIQLLLGDVPERALFRQPILARPLLPYLALDECSETGRSRCIQASRLNHIIMYLVPTIPFP